ncbi:hypothetical protein B0H66DRAFT_251066 [Apodospora peruviana]|uniref:Conidiation-specific protein n=1 Tax=Apodospora peruviana TaxID=516989 RepID=A0AAE0I572_9PEZI|nr:hypothetical protein B0H66DRAFT_251066 [Apodospora peruviana]
MIFSKPTVAAALAFFGAASAQNKPLINPAFPGSRMETDLRNNLKPTHSTWDYWGAGWIPQGCRDIATSHNLNPADFTVFNVHYDDCSEPWSFCRHKRAGASEIDMIDIFGRLPVRSRSFVRHFVATPGLNDGAAAFTYYSGDVVFEDRPTIMTFVHEVSHSLDWHALTQYGSPFSNTAIWRDNFNADKASVTDYSRTNWMENFAEVGKVGVYDKVVPGGIGPIQPAWRDVFHQYATYQGYLGDNILPGGSCRNRFGNSPPVKMSNSAKMMTRALGPKPDVSFKNSNLTIIEIDPTMEHMVISDTTSSVGI